MKLMVTKKRLITSNELLKEDPIAARKLVQALPAILLKKTIIPRSERKWITIDANPSPSSGWKRFACTGIQDGQNEMHSKRRKLMEEMEIDIPELKAWFEGAGSCAYACKAQTSARVDVPTAPM